MAIINLIKSLVIASIWTTTAQAETVQVRPVSPITDSTRIIGFTSTDPIVEFTSPDRWILKQNGVIKRNLADQTYELILQVEPSYGLAKARELQLQKEGLFRVFLPLPIHLLGADIYVSDLLGELQAAFVPYPGNEQSNFYFRMTLNGDQLQTLFRLSLQGLSLLGDVRFSLKLGDFETETTVPIQISINPGLLDASYARDHPWVRYLKADNGQNGGLAGNGHCDGGELCVFQQLSTGKLWVPVRGERKNRDEWQSFCRGLISTGLTGMTLPTKDEVESALREGLWEKMRREMFFNEWWWGTRTTTEADGQQNSFWINIDSGNTFPLHDQSNKSDRSICVST